ncbi:hypothetical protein GCM10023195_33190 [Actinoallomurus liliacearum]|uniref:Uncharacterized protein n=1 Tax=Actinoallomurus liliacearum TaxID=1080073 RepID=A0ABP8TLX6_9ACTN
MLFNTYAAPGGEFHHPALFYLVIAIFGIVIVSAIVISLLAIVLRNVDREWPIGTLPKPASWRLRSRMTSASVRRHLPHRRHSV